MAKDKYTFISLCCHQAQAYLHANAAAAAAVVLLNHLND